MIPDLPRHFYNQPLLYAGWNFDSINEWEFNSPGRAEPVWPEYFETFEPLQPFILTPELTNVFDGCPDITIRATRNTIVPPPGIREITVR